MFKTTLQRLDNVDRSDWINQLGLACTELLYLTEQSGDEVEVVAQVVDGDGYRGYYDIKVCGVEIPAISGIHLRHIENFAAHGKPITLGLQFALELKVEGYVPDSPLDHEQMQRALSLFIERALVNFGYEGHRTTLGSLLYEADYPLDN